MLTGKVASKVVALAVVLCLVSAPVGAGMQGYVDGQVGEMQNIAKSFSPNTVSAQGRNFVTLGGFRDRFELNGEIRPLSVTLPSLAFGCGGVDLNWGGMSALEFKYIIDAFKHILQVAPAMAFQMAFSQLCRDCASIMSSLQKAASMINSLSLDKCKAAQQAGALLSHTGAAITGLVAPNIGSAAGGWQSVFATTTDGKQDTNSVMSQFESWMNTANQYINCDPGKIAAGGYASCAAAAKTKMKIKPGSLLNDAFKEPIWSTYAGDVSEMENVLRALIGDVLTTKKVSAADGSVITTNPWPSDSGMTPVDFHDALFGILDNTGTAKTMKRVSVSYDSDNNPSPDGETSIAWAGIYPKVNQSFTNIVNAIRSDTPIPSSSPDLAFVYVADFPAYRILNLFSAVEATSTEDNIRVLSAVVTHKMISLIAARIGERVSKVLSAFAAGQLDSLVADAGGSGQSLIAQMEKMKKRLNAQKRQAEERYQRSTEELQKAVVTAAAYQNMEAKLLKTVMTHVLAGQYITSRSWGR